MKFKAFVLLPTLVFLLSLLVVGEFCSMTPLFEDKVETGALTVQEEVYDLQEQILDYADTPPEDRNAQETDNDSLDTADAFGVIEPEVEEKVEPIRIIAVGDIMLGRGVGMRLENEGRGYTFPFEKTAGILKSGDVVFGNLEHPITDNENSLDKRYKYVLRAKPEAIEGLEYAGFNLLSLANNHILDHYEEGLFDTMDILESKGMVYSGAGRNMQEARKLAVIEKKGLKVGLLSYTDMSEYFYRGNPSINFIAGEDKAGVAPNKPELIKEDVALAREQVDLLIVSLHWGVEESFNVLPEQTAFAHSLIDMGVDAILGHHPHQFHGIEIYKGKPIAYSLGNFIFDQNDPENQESFILDMEFLDRKLLSFTAIPVRTINKTQVVPVKGSEAQDLITREIELSAKFGSKCSVVDDAIVFEVEQ